MKITIEPNTPNEEEIYIDTEEIKDNGDGTYTLKVLADTESFKGIVGSKGTS